MGTNVKRGKVLVVMGSTATGKSKLAVDLALRFGGEVVNSDKIQVHDGLDVATNKVTDEERCGVPHHLIGGVHPDSDYSVEDFRRDATRAVELVLARGRVPIIAGGSNSFLEALLDGDEGSFRRCFECSFLWVDADLPVLHRYIHHRVDRMVEQGLVDEVREFFRPDGDYSRGISRAIGVPEMDAYFLFGHQGGCHDDDEKKKHRLDAAVARIKVNTCVLACRQLRKIHRLQTLPGWNLRRLDVTGVLSLKLVNKDSNAAWETDVAGPATMAVAIFLQAAGSSATAAADCCGLQLEKPLLPRSRSFLGMETVPAVV